ncbi:Arrestin-like [Trypanosoma melophagium]|uniref:Arrestin-like n=1 Tax=Trypanosoma melophagium TaxID=715481 RepID=UPI00351A27F6|nr:Arrestin-like [Trypanosoma melophagium]
MDNFRKHSKHIDSFRVLLRHLHRYPGDKLKGVVEITVNHPLKYSLLETRIIGEESTRFGTSLSWRFDSETRRNVYYKQRVIIAGIPPTQDEKGTSDKNSSDNWSDADRSTVDTMESANIVTVGLMPGTYTFPFTVVLPDILPPSYSDNRGTGYSRLTYSLKTKLYAGTRVLGKDRTFFTVRMLPVNPLQWIAVHRKINPHVRSSSTVLLEDAAEGTSAKEGKELSDNDEERNDDEDHNDDNRNDEYQVSQGSKTVLIDHQFSLCNEDELKDAAIGNGNSEGDNINDDAASLTPFHNLYGVDPNEAETKKGKKKGKGKDKDKEKEKEREKKEKKKEEKEKKKKEKMEKKKNKKKNGEAFEDATNAGTENNDENNCNDAEREGFEGKEDAHSNTSERDSTRISNKNASSDENAENTPPQESLNVKKEKPLDQDEEHSQQEEQSPHGGLQRKEEEIDEDRFIPVDPAFSDGQMWEYKLDVPISFFFKKGTASVCVSIHSIICCRGKPVTFRAVVDNSRGISAVTKVVFMLVNRVRMSSRVESFEYKTVLREKALRDHTCREHKFGIPESQLILPNNTPLTLLTEGYACRTFLEVKVSCVYGLRTHTGTARTEIAVVDTFNTQGNSQRVKKWTNYYRGREIAKDSEPYPDVICPFVTGGEMLVVEDELERLSASIPPPTISSTSEIKASKKKNSLASKQGANVDYERVVYRPRSEPGAGAGVANPFWRSSWGKRVDLDD